MNWNQTRFSELGVLDCQDPIVEVNISGRSLMTSPMRNPQIPSEDQANSSTFLGAGRDISMPPEADP